MFKGFEDIQKANRENIDVALTSLGCVSKGVQAIGAEVADYSKKSFEEGTAAFERLVGAKNIDTAIEAQTDFLKTAYEGYVGQVTKIGEIYADMAKGAYEPFGKVFASKK